MNLIKAMLVSAFIIGAPIGFMLLMQFIIDKWGGWGVLALVFLVLTVAITAAFNYADREDENPRLTGW